MSVSRTAVAVVGAGPYGLSVAAHLRARGTDFRVFGAPMRTWLRMPANLNLKSLGFATNIYVPHADYTFVEYCQKNGLEDFEPCSMASFAQYGLWVQRQIVPNVETVDVTEVRAAGDDFEVTLANDERFRAGRVLIAVGLSYFARMPDFLAGLPRELASHTSHNSDVSVFKGKDVAVIGAGSSALETATLLHEVGARPQLLVRGPAVEFNTRMDKDRPLLDRLRNPNSVMGTGRESWLMEKVPLIMHYVPDARRVRLTRSYLGPSGAWWLWSRFDGKVPVHLNSAVTAAVEDRGRVRLTISEAGRGTRTMTVDHVIAGTGYEPDLDRLPFLKPDLLARLRRIERAPALSRHFESSVPGLYFVGLASAFSFGPLFRFVCGASYAAPAVAKHLAR